MKVQTDVRGRDSGGTGDAVASGNASTFPVGVVASCLGISGFTTAIVVGVGAGNDASDVLIRAMFASAGCYLAGVLLSAAAAHAVHEHLNGFRAAHPISDGNHTSPKQSELVNEGGRSVEKTAV